MAAPNVNVDPTQYTTSINSVFGRIAATLENLGKTETGEEFVERSLQAYFNPLKGLIEIDDDKRWLADYTGIEDGDSSFTWDLGEYATGKLAELKPGYTTTNEPVVVNANVIISVKEALRYKSETDKIFEKFIAGKFLKAQRDIVEGIISRFVTEVLNKLDNTSSSYLHADLQPTLSENHAYSNGVGFSNVVKVLDQNTNTYVLTGISEAAFDALRKLASTIPTSSGVPIGLKYDTIIVSAGSDNEKEAARLLGINLGMGNVSNTATVAGDAERDTYPQSTNQVNVYYGAAKLVSVPGMDPDLWLAVDTSKPSPIVFRVVQRPTEFDMVVRENGVRQYSYYGAVEFWAKLLPKNVAGSRG